MTAQVTYASRRYAHRMTTADANSPGAYFAMHNGRGGSTKVRTPLRNRTASPAKPVIARETLNLSALILH